MSTDFERQARRNLATEETGGLRAVGVSDKGGTIRSRERGSGVIS